MCESPINDVAYNNAIKNFEMYQKKNTDNVMREVRTQYTKIINDLHDKLDDLKYELEDSQEELKKTKERQEKLSYLCQAKISEKNLLANTIQKYKKANSTLMAQLAESNEKIEILERENIYLNRVLNKYSYAEEKFNRKVNNAMQNKSRIPEEQLIPSENPELPIQNRSFDNLTFRNLNVPPLYFRDK